MYSLSDFNYELPEHLIAQAPLENRRDSRLLILRKNASLEHKNFVDLLDLLSAGDALVVNNSKVMKARLSGSKVSGGKVEILLVRPLSGGLWLALVKAKGRKEKLHVKFKNGSATIVGSSEDDPGAFIVEFHGDLDQIIEECGDLPLPPYIERASTLNDFSRYQTVYANASATQSVAAPTAGLHFDETFLEAIKAKGVRVVPVTLHVGPGTFMPVRHEDLSLHKMHAELAQISPESAQIINETKRRGGRVIAVGTTAMRTLESAATEGGMVEPGSKLTRLFITPGFKFKVVDALVTNFHLPKTTLLMLVSAVAGRDRLLNAYDEAIKHSYRFFSYGDATYLEVTNNHE